LQPALLVSIHDVSPLTLEASQRLVCMVAAHGVALHALTVLIIPQHEDGPTLDTDLPTCRWLHHLVKEGACLCLHGLTHRMSGAARGPGEWLWSRGFARGQGELYLSDRADCERRLDMARAIIKRCGLADKVHGFVPPAWLLSPAAADVVLDVGFAFHERFAGIRAGDALLARRLIGFGSLSAVESRVTAAYAWLQSHARPRDTRLAIHPADAQRASTRRAIDRTLRRLLPRTRPMNYVEFLASKGTGRSRLDLQPPARPA
jgi:predicted deacetylase